MLSLTVIIIAFCASFVAMLSGGFWGLGGGWLVMPVLLLCGVPIEVAVPASLLQMVPSTFPTVVRQIKSLGWGRNSWGYTVAIPMCIASFAGSVGGAPVGDLLEYLFHTRKLQEIFFLGILILVFYQSIGIKAAKPSAGAGVCAVDLRKKIYIALAGFFTGLISSLAGLGGGSLVRPLLRNLLKAPEDITGKISRLSVFLVAFAGASAYLVMSGTWIAESLTLAAVLTAGGMPGFALGAKMHGLVVRSGKDALAGRSFAFFILIVIISLFCKLTGFIETGRILICAASAGILIFLCVITLGCRRKNLPREIESSLNPDILKQGD
ncbi:MAG: sulfite exporter TauE/SafE family protein [Lentisphaerota bacterium]